MASSGRRARLLTLAASLALGLVLGEVLARLLLPRLPAPPGAAWLADAECGFRLRPSPPGSLPEQHDDHVNRHGFRDRDYPLRKPAGTFRIAGLGDSFVYGAVPVAENFLAVCEQRLRAAEPALRPQVLRIGCPGYSPEHLACLLERFVLGLDPDLVVLNLFVGNDVTGIPVRGRVVGGRMYHPHSPIGWLDLARRSQLFQLVEGVVYRGLKRRLADQRAGAASPAAGAAAPAIGGLYLKILGNNMPVYLDPPDRRMRRLWDEALGYLDRIDAACRDAGVPWLLVLIPAEEQVDEAVLKQAIAGLGLDREAVAIDSPQRRLRDWADRRDVPCLDLLPVMRAAHADTARLYLPEDTHWNRRGNAVAGAALAEVLAGYVEGTAGRGAPPPAARPQ